MIHLFLTATQITKSMNTFISYRTAMRHIMTDLKDQELNDETLLSMVVKWKDEISANTIRYRLTVLTQLLRYLGDNTDWLTKIANSITANYNLQECPTQQEFEAILAEVPSHKYKAIILLMAKSGARVSEAISLNLGDIDLEKGVAIVRDTKNGEDRLLRLTPDTVEEIRFYQNRERTPTSETKLFTSCHGEQKKITTQVQIKRYCEAAGLSKYHCHSFRHYFAQRLIDNNCSLPIVQKAMGHKSSRSTEKYYKVNFNTVINAVDTAFN